MLTETLAIKPAASCRRAISGVLCALNWFYFVSRLRSDAAETQTVLQHQAATGIERVGSENGQGVF